MMAQVRLHPDDTAHARRCRLAGWAARAAAPISERRTMVRSVAVDAVLTSSDDMPELESAPSKGAADDDDEEMPPLTCVALLQFGRSLTGPDPSRRQS